MIWSVIDVDSYVRCYEPVVASPECGLPQSEVPDEVIARYFYARSAWTEANAELEEYYKKQRKTGEGKRD